MDITIRNYIYKMGTIFASFSFALIGPTHAYFVLGIKTTTTEARLPFCEPNSNAEFMGNIFLQVTLAIHGILLYFGLEVFLTLFENVVTIAPKLIKSELDETIEWYTSKSISETECHWRIGQIVKQSKDINK